MRSECHISPRILDSEAMQICPDTPPLKWYPSRCGPIETSAGLTLAKEGREVREMRVSPEL